MPKKLVEEPIFVESLQEIELLSKNHNRSQKIIYICRVCNQSHTSSMYKHGGGLIDNLICTKCKREQPMLNKFGSVSITSSNYFKEKSKTTKLKRYGDPLFNNPAKQK